jgi:asparagine synthase (glutamine-hydrolysing)
MCGIVGIFLNPQSVNPRGLRAVEPMADTLRHRGPDGGGTWVDRASGIALGHRRLAIVDLSEAGRQPMVSHSEALIMTFNGEIYNFVELRDELESGGHRFRGHSDSEVMLAAFEKFGIEKTLRRLAGMFALGVFDRQNRVLHLIRDRIGKKPLYVALVGRVLLFASELKSLRAYPGFRPIVDLNALAMVLRYGFVPDQHCIWQGVFKLPPGTMLSVRAEDLGAASAQSLRDIARPWWSLAQVVQSGQQGLLDLPVERLETELDQLLRLVVRQRMVADVPLGAFLSGGIDSSTIVALMQAQSSRPVRTFTIGFSEARYDEAQHAALVAQHIGSEHTEMRLTPFETREVIPDLPRIWDEPFADESQIPTLLVSKLARRHVTVALTGDGGDECFGGYTRHLMSSRLAPILALPVGLRRMASSTMRFVGPNVLRVIEQCGRSLNGEHLYKFASILGANDEGDLYSRLIALGRNPGCVGSETEGAQASLALANLVDRIMFRDMTTYLPGDILVKTDRASMAVSLEARCPFLDHRVVEFVWRLPVTMKVRGGQGKWLLRRLLRRYLPDALFERPKQGFNVPIGAWLVGPLREWAHELLDQQRIRSDGLLDAARVQACWQEHLIGRSDRSRELWAILMIQAWLEENRSSNPPQSAFACDGASVGFGPCEHRAEISAYG